MDFGSRLKQLREKSGLSKAELANKLGVSRPAVSQWENGDTMPTIDRLKPLATVLGVSSIDELMGPEDQAKERFIAAAFDLLRQARVNEIDVERICERAGLTRNEFFAIFDSKQDLLFEVATSYNDRTFGELERIAPSYGPLDARIKQLLHIYYANDLDHIDLTAELQAYSWQWGPEREKRNREQMSAHHDVLIAMLDEAARAGEIQPANYRTTSQLILAAYTYALRDAVYDRRAASEIVRTITPQIDLILAGLGFRGGEGN